MKRFRFPFDAILRLRGQELEVEESRLAALLLEERILGDRSRELGHQEWEESLALVSRPYLDAAQFELAERFRRFALAERKRLDGAMRAISAQIAAQRLRVLAVRTRKETLATLRTRHKDRWRAELDREQEQSVAELVVARWKRQN
jgi:hypothetical protein